MFRFILSHWDTFGYINLKQLLDAALAKKELSGIIVGVLLYFCAIIEQINYFHIRLSYETVNGRLLVIDPIKKIFTGIGKRSQLRKDIDTYLGV